MANPFYTPTGIPAAQSRGTSGGVRTEYNLVQAGFDGVNVALAGKATSSGQVWTGANDFTGATVTVAAPTVPASAATKAYVDAETAARIAASASLAPLASPALTGVPSAPTAAGGNNTTQIATTAYVFGNFAPLASPTFTGTPSAPTAAGGTNTTQVATTAFVIANNVSSAPLASPAFTGVPTAPTAGLGNNSTQIATTAYVAANAVSTVSPAFTGIPTAPTAAPGTNTTQLATTAYVTANSITSTNPAFTGTMTLNSTVANPLAAFTVTATGTSGATIQLQGGGTNGNKTIRVLGGVLHIINNAYNSQIVTIDDSGNSVFMGTVTAAGLSGPLTGNVTGNASGTSANVTGTVAIGNGGTGGITAASALNNLGISGVYALLASPALTGTPTATTQATADSSAAIATTQFVKNLNYQGYLGYTPVQQGTGVSQGSNVVKIGWSAGSRLRLTVDVTDLGNFAMEGSNNTFGANQRFSSGLSIGANNVFAYESSTNAFSIRTGAAGSDKYSIFDTAGSLTLQGGINAISASIAGAGTPLVVNSTSSYALKLAMQDAGTVRGYLGANASFCCIAYNNAAVSAFTIDNAGNGVFGGSVTATSFVGAVNPTIVLATSADLNTAITSGFYRLSATPVNGPAGVSVDYSQMIVSRGTDTISQQVSAYGTGRTFIRSGSPTQVGGTGSYGAWNEVAFLTLPQTFASNVAFNGSATFSGGLNIASGGLAVTGGATISGNTTALATLSVNPTSVSNATGTLVVTNTGTQGASITLAGNGATTPNKTFRVVNGVLQMVNSAYSASVLSIDDGGGITTSSGVTATGAVNGAALYAGTPRSEGDLISLSTSAAGQATFRWYQAAVKEWAMGMSSGSANLNIFENNGLGTVSFTFAGGGNFTAAGNVSGVSDERIKTNWRAVRPNFLEELATIKSGIYDRTDCVMTQAGVSAQDIQRILPEVVQVDEDGRLSLAYGNAAMVAVIELTKRVLAIEARLVSMA